MLKHKFDRHYNLNLDTSENVRKISVIRNLFGICPEYVQYLYIKTNFRQIPDNNRNRTYSERTETVIFQDKFRIISGYNKCPEFVYFFIRTVSGQYPDIVFS